MKPPKVSVLMAVYNAEKYLRQAIESILGQSFGDFELLINDDGSTDASAEIIQSFRDCRIHAIQNSISRGAARVRNQCLRIARGEYVAILDADDIAHQDRLQIQVDFLDRNRGVALVGSRYEIIDQSGRVTGNQNVPTGALTIKWKLLLGNQFGHSTVMYRRKDVLDVGGYDQTMCPAEDFDLWVRLARRSRLANLECSVSQYRVHSENATLTTTSTVKENSLSRVVAKSIHFLTGERVDLGVARALAKDIDKPAPSEPALKLAFGTLCLILEHLIDSVARNRRDNETLVKLAVQDLFALADRNPGSLGLALTKSLWSVAKYDPCSLVRKHYIGTVANQILPSGVVRAVKRISRMGSAPAPNTNSIVTGSEYTRI